MYQYIFVQKCDRMHPVRIHVWLRYWIMYLYYSWIGSAQNQGTHDEGWFYDGDLSATAKPTQLLPTCSAELRCREGWHGLFCAGVWEAR